MIRGPGAWCQLPSPLSGEIMAGLGFGWACVDMQHGPITIETAAAMVQSISVTGATPIVRVTSNEPWLIGQALDVGASGVIVPMVSTRAEAERAARACRYAPEGTRSFGPVRAPATERVFCVAMVETREAVENVKEICSVAGVDGIYVGPWDLSLAHGLAEPGPETEPAIARVLAACRSAGVAAGIAAGSGEAARTRLDAGFSFVGLASDFDFLAQAARRELEAALGGPPPTRDHPDGLVRAAL